MTEQNRAESQHPAGSQPSKPDGTTSQRDEFLGILSHEMRTPLGAIIGYHELLAEGIFGKLDPRVSDGIDRMRSAADQLLALAAGISDAALSDPSLMLTDIRPCSIGDIFQNAMDALANEAVGRATRVVVDEQPEIETIHSDPDRLERAIILVLHAAIKNTPGGTLTVRAWVQGGWFELSLAGAKVGDHDVPLASPLASRSACALRLSIASHTLKPLGGDVTVTDPDDDPLIRLRAPAPH